ncbi:MAG: DUF2802 domain-containing protein [Proteobacteria bacterium]|nr:DUF2802 domain-containing protein [Pseudomonadota bacterium]MBS0554366.1 DUF2802 domain-containing protein [Pseudomonadota bacterium]
MTASLLAGAGVLLALAAAFGAWWYVRARGLVPTAARSSGAAVSSPPATPAGSEPEDPAHEHGQGDDKEGDEGFDYAPELRPRPAPLADEATFRNAFDWQHMRRELERLQARCDAQDRVIAGLRAEVEDLRDCLASPAVASAPAGVSTAVSPEYDAPLVYARQGLDAAAIAERCGITLAEAQLVCAMAGARPQTGKG